jgi:N-acetylglutamate synthase/N-acetylornithine aminotransferase
VFNLSIQVTLLEFEKCLNKFVLRLRVVITVNQIDDIHRRLHHDECKSNVTAESEGSDFIQPLMAIMLDFIVEVAHYIVEVVGEFGVVVVQCQSG